MKSPKVYCDGVKMVPLKDIRPNPENPNKHPRRQIELLADIIKAHGWRNPIIVSNRSGLIVRGHGRFEAAKLLEVKSAPVQYQDYETEAEEYQDMIADNAIAELGELDMDAVNELKLEFNLDEALLGIDLSELDKNPDDKKTGDGKKADPKATYDDYSEWKLVLKHDTKLRWVKLLDHVRAMHKLDKLEDAMVIVMDGYEAAVAVGQETGKEA